MWTFGRDHEMQHALKWVKRAENAPLVAALIDAVHDLKEGTGSVARLRQCIHDLYVSRGERDYPVAQEWLRRSYHEHPELLDLWHAWAAHPRAEIRLRVACDFDVIPLEHVERIAAVLVNDRSSKVAHWARYYQSARSESNFWARRRPELAAWHGVR